MHQPAAGSRDHSHVTSHDGPTPARWPPQIGRRWRWMTAVLVVLGAAAAIAVALLDDPLAVPPAVGVTEVELRDNAFGPAVIAVAAGTEVTWTWVDRDEEHNLVGEGWGDQTPRATGTYRQAFDRPGSYLYRCTLHFRMSGRVDVVEPDTTN